MASTKEYLDFVLEQLSGIDEVNSNRSDLWREIQCRLR